jgi:hypothetical protein
MNAQETGGVAFRYARGKLVWYALGGFGFVALCAWLLAIGAAPYGSFKHAVLMFGVAFFGLAGLMALRSMAGRRDIVAISPQGITDIRISPSLIPWTAIRGMSMRETRGQRFIMLDVDPAVEKALPLTRTARWTMPMNAAIGFRGLVLNPAGLDASADEIVAALVRFEPPADGAAN